MPSSPPPTSTDRRRRVPPHGGDFPPRRTIPSRVASAVPGTTPAAPHPTTRRCIPVILGRHRKPAPRLAAELDDTELGTVCRRITGRGAGHTRVLVAPLVQRLLDDAGDDWDRRAHRLAVLTASTRPSTQRSWAQHDSRHPDAHTLFAWGAMARGTRTPPTTPSSTRPSEPA